MLNIDWNIRKVMKRELDTIWYDEFSLGAACRRSVYAANGSHFAYASRAEYARRCTI